MVIYRILSQLVIEPAGYVARPHCWPLQIPQASLTSAIQVLCDLICAS